MTARARIRKPMGMQPMTQKLRRNGSTVSEVFRAGVDIISKCRAKRSGKGRRKNTEGAGSHRLPAPLPIYSSFSSAQRCLSLRKTRHTSTPAKAMPRNSSAAPLPFPLPSRRRSAASGPSAAISGSQT